MNWAGRRRRNGFSCEDPAALRKEPIYHYNMGCYEALLGNLHCAQQHLQISFKMDASFRDLASRDPDLQAVHALI